MLLSILLLLAYLAYLPFLTSLWPLFLCAFGIFVGVKLFSGRMLGRLLALGWFILGLISGIVAWNAAIGNSLNPALPPRRSGFSGFLFVCAYFWAAGLYLFLTVVKDRIQALDFGNSSLWRRR